jgi:hypothetical protein
MTAEEILKTHIRCEGMSARISERQCKINQAKCRTFVEHGRDYFIDWRHSETFREIGEKYKNPYWGGAGDAKWIDPNTLACLNCERYQT